MNEQTKSAIRHVLTALLALVGFLGLGEWAGLVELVSVNLDAVWDAIIALVGFVGAIIAFFKDSGRFTARANNSSS